MTKTLICPATGTKLEVQEGDVERFLLAGYKEPAAPKKTTRKKKEPTETAEEPTETE